MTSVRINTNEGKYDKEYKVLTFTSNGVFPETLEVMSSRTGRVIVFRMDHEAAEQNEFWDGEACEYISDTAIPGLDRIYFVCAENPAIVCLYDTNKDVYRHG